ncbi:MAG: O-methyltransferase [Bacteroidia bacterium]
MVASKPYSRFKITRKYISYITSSQSRHDIHSPFVYSFVDEVLKPSSDFRKKDIEIERKRLEKSKQVIDFVDYGKSGNMFRKNISDIAKRALKSKKYAQLLGKIVEYYNASTVLELGTSLGITTAYLAASAAHVTTLEGDPKVSEIAQGVWNQLGLTNISSIVGNFDKTLDNVVDKRFDIIYIDGNHKLEPTLRYFHNLKQKAHDGTIFIFDDIHYSKEMESAWDKIKMMDEVRVTIDLFFIGIVALSPSLSKENYSVRF